MQTAHPPVLAFVLAFSLISVLGFSQDQPCATDEHHAYLMRTDARYKERFLSQQTLLRAAVTKEAGHRQNPPQYTIPVVVHIIHLGELIGKGSNISDAQIYDAIAGLNERFANVNGLGQDIEISFCLANRDPNGCPSSGINRVNGSGITGYATEGVAWSDNCGANELEVKALSHWPVESYYNIWVVRDICGDISGYAYYPNGDWFDGTIIDIASMNSTSRTLAHEVGHGLNLAHTFNGDEDGSICPDDSDCLLAGDEICDTPPHRRNDCGVNNTCGGGGVWENSRFNWMSYCPTDSASGRFTEDQRIRMRAALLEWPRVSLTESDGCANPESMQFTSEASLMCSGESRILAALPAGGFFAVAGGPGQITGNVLTATAGGVIAVEYIVSLPGCSSSVVQEIPVKQAAASKLIVPGDSLCMNQTAMLKGLPGGGDFSVLSGPGIVEGNELTPTGPGLIELTYTVTVLGCETHDEASVMAVPAPQAEIEALAGDVLSAIPVGQAYQWLRCDQAYEPVEEASGQSLTVTASGSYSVEVSNGVCRDTSDCLDVIISSTGETDREVTIRIYPNPAKDLVLATIPEMPARVLLSNLQGQLLPAEGTFAKDAFELNVSTLPSGLYVLRMELRDGTLRHGRFIRL